MKRPPRVYKNKNKYFIKLDNEKHVLDFSDNSAESVKDILRDHRLQQLVNKKLQHYKTKPHPVTETQQIGLGSIHRGLTNFDIEHVMSELGLDKKGFLGCVSVDEIGEIDYPHNKKAFSFILNTSNHKIKNHGHWISCWVDKSYAKQICLFDSFGNYVDEDKEFADELREQLKILVDRFDLPYMLLMKMNMLQQQPTYDENGKYSDVCGFYAMQFLVSMYNTGGNFSISSRLDQVDDQQLIDSSNEEIQHFKNTLIQDGYL